MLARVHDGKSCRWNRCQPSQGVGKDCPAKQYEMASKQIAMASKLIATGSNPRNPSCPAKYESSSLDVLLQAPSKTKLQVLDVCDARETCDTAEILETLEDARLSGS